MHDSKEPKGKSFTVFRSAAEEAEMKSAEQDWANEGGHMSSTSGRVINRPGEGLPFRIKEAKLTSKDQPFVAVLSHHGSECTEHGLAKMREAEAFI